MKVQKISISCILLLVGLVACQSPASTESNTDTTIVQEAVKKPTLVFVHGWNINGEYWNAQRTYFQENYQVHTPDFPLEQDSTSTYSIEEYTDQLLHYLDQHQLTDVVLVGHSLGGDIVLGAALQDTARVIGVIGIDNFKDVTDTFPPTQDEEIEQFFDLLENDYQGISAAYAARNLFHDSSHVKHISRVTEDFSQAPPTIAIATLKSYMSSFKKEADQLKNLRHKLYLINSTFSPTDTIALGRYCSAGYEVRYMDLVGHFPMIENDTLFNQLLEETLQEIHKKKLTSKKGDL